LQAPTGQVPVLDLDDDQTLLGHGQNAAPAPALGQLAAGLPLPAKGHVPLVVAQLRAGGNRVAVALDDPVAGHAVDDGQHAGHGAPVRVGEVNVLGDRDEQSVGQDVVFEHL
jgi:hypothetical protein